MEGLDLRLSRSGRRANICLGYDRQVPGYYVENFGCRATQADGAALERQFAEHGVQRASSAADASIVVFNTCTVTATADQDARAAIRRTRRRNPKARIVVTGCYAQRAPEEVATLPGVSLVVGNSHKHQLAGIALLERLPGGTSFIPLASLVEDQERGTESSIFVSDIFAHTELLAAPVFDAANERTRPNLKVQDGCDNRCSFCVIPYVRGASRSMPLERIINEINSLVRSGYREVVISGINLGRWGRDLKAQAQDLGAQSPGLRPRTQAAFREFGFAGLVGSILDETRLEKLRISSVEPMDWTDELIALVASSPRIAKHAHVPMQSGSDAVLRRMHRKYRPWHYREKIMKVRAAMPTAAIGADVMVGFPGETEAEFDATLRMIEQLPFTYLHVFTFSPRPGTPAAIMPSQVPVHIARERNGALRELAAQKKLAFMRSLRGKEIEAITLKRAYGTGGPAHEGVDDEFTEGLTDNYLKLHLKGQHEANQWLRVRIEDVADGGLTGSVCERG